MGLLGDLKAPVAGVVGSLLVIVGVVLLGLLDLASTLTESGVGLLDLVATAVPYLVGLVLVGLVGVAFLLWGLYRLASGAVSGDSRLLRNDRVATLVSYLEGKNRWVRRLELSEVFEPTDRDRARRERERAERELERLKDDYAAGRLDEREFERELDRLLSDSDLDRTEIYRERDRAVRERE